MSLNGALVRAERIFPSGSLVKINLFVAQMQPVVGRGLLMRTVSNNQIQFEGLYFSESTRLQDFLLPLVAA